MRAPLTTQRNAHKKQDNSLFRNRKLFSGLAKFFEEGRGGELFPDIGSDIRE